MKKIWKWILEFKIKKYKEGAKFMKDLKFKVILAILVVIMSFSTCFAFEELTDIEGTKYEIPVYALRELDLMDGYPDDTFEPNGIVTRGEMIKVLVSAYGIGAAANESKSDNTFNDVPANYWASGYINLAYDWDFLIESADTDFRPNATITYSEALTYCLRVLGYGNVIDSKGSWPTNYISKAHDLKLTKDLEFDSYSDGLNRGDWAILLWNVMNTRMWENSSRTSETFMEIKHSNKVEDIERLIEELTAILPTGIELESTSETVCIGIKNAKTTIYGLVKAKVMPENATEKTLYYTNGNPSVLKVESGGYVLSANSVGQTVITVETLNGIKEECIVNVVEHEYFAEKEVEYDDNNHWEIHTCTYCGIEIGKKNVEGHTYVNGKCECGKEEPKPAEILPTGISLESTSKTVCIGIERTKIDIYDLVNAKVLPENATNKQLSYGYNNNVGALKIEHGGFVVSAQKTGQSVISIRTINGIEREFTVNVVDHEYFAEKEVEYDDNNHWELHTCTYCGIEIGKKNVENHTFVDGVCKCGKKAPKTLVSTLEFENEIMNLELGFTKQLNLKITPDEANEKITYTSNNKSYVTVDSNGKIKAVKAGGIATITAKTESGKTATCKVVVPKGVVSKMVIGTSSDKDGLNSDDVWVSSDESIVAFEDEKYIAKKLGKCMLTAYLKDNPNILTAKVEVEVVETLGTRSIEVIGKKDYTLEIGDEIDVEAEIISTIENDNVSKYKLTWKSSDSNIVTVKGNNREAKLIAKGEGTCNIVVNYEGMKSTIKVTVIDPNASVEYEDVKQNDWFEESVKYVTDNKLMNGMGDNKFSPSSNMTRGMIVTVLYRMSESSYNGKSTFADVKQGEYYSSAVAWAAENEIINGVGDNKFAPNAEITREQLIVILYRYAKFMKIDVNVGKNTNILSYDDFSEIAEYSFSAFQWGCGKGIISGRTSTTLNPKGSASRAEVATMLMRFIEN